MLAGLHEQGLLNQGLMYFAARETGGKLADFAKIKGLLGSQADGEPLEKVSSIIEKLNEMLKIGDVTVDKKDGGVSIRIKTDPCRYRPKGVGGAEFDGTLCPFPGLIEEFLNAFLNEKVKLVGIGLENKPVIKEGGYCVLHYVPYYEK